ncbi:hypothetical protein BC940DRAFT_324156 [Gongronella butleri]|nr:hypothetical protein BC940DRAFT_324156 [Gongronella butleri]
MATDREPIEDRDRSRQFDQNWRLVVAASLVEYKLIKRQKHREGFLNGAFDNFVRFLHGMIQIAMDVADVTSELSAGLNWARDVFTRTSTVANEAVCAQNLFHFCMHPAIDGAARPRSSPKSMHHMLHQLDMARRMSYSANSGRNRVVHDTQRAPDGALGLAQMSRMDGSTESTLG